MPATPKSTPEKKDVSVDRAERRFRAYKNRVERIACSRRALVQEMWYEKPFKYWFTASKNCNKEATQRR